MQELDVGTPISQEKLCFEGLVLDAATNTPLQQG